MGIVSSFAFLLLITTAVVGQKNEEERLSQAYAFLIYPEVFDGILVEAPETPVQFRGLVYLNLANYNAWCNYHPTAADIFGRTRFKQPADKHTTENKNTASMYAILRIYEESPQSFGGIGGMPAFRKLMMDRGLDPDDKSLSMTTAIGVGNREGMDTARLMRIDNWNAEGDLTGTQDAYKLPFQDFTNYVPKNNPWKIRFPFRWQPLLETNGLGFFFRQEHVVPFAGASIAFSMSPRDVRRRRVKSPYLRKDASVKNASKKDIETLRRSARKVFTTSARLTEKQRILAELFDNKISGFRTSKNPLGTASIGAAIRFFILGPELDLTLDEEIIYGMGTNIAAYDALVMVWKEKRRQDAIRPTGQTMEFLFGQKKFTVSGGPYKDNVRISAGEWLPYIRTMPHSEYPSASACVCSAVVEHALVNTKGRDVFPYNISVAAGSSRFLPGEFPRNDVTIPVNRLTEWAELCGKSRLWAGVHFEPAIEAGVELCKGIGTNAQKTMDRLVAGQMDPNWMKWIRPGTDRFWERD